jgi:hypothetical protein
VLHDCSLWTTIPAADKEARAALTSTYVEIAQYSTNAIRAGTALYLQSYSPKDGKGLAANLKVFALLRVVFEVPKSIKAAELIPPRRYAIWGNPSEGDSIDLLWPFSIDSAGKLELTGVDDSFHSGPMADEISDFQVMELTLQRRFPATK